MLATERKHESEAEKWQHCVLEACTGGSFQLSRAEAKMYSQRYIRATSAPVVHPLQAESHGPRISAESCTTSHVL